MAKNKVAPFLRTRCTTTFQTEEECRHSTVGHVATILHVGLTFASMLTGFSM